MHLESNRTHHIISKREPNTNPRPATILTREQVLEILGTPNPEEIKRRKIMEDWRWRSAQKDVRYSLTLA